MKADLNMAQEALVGLLLLATPRTSCRLSDPAACHRPVSFKQTPQTEPQTKIGEGCLSLETLKSTAAGAAGIRREADLHTLPGFLSWDRTGRKSLLRLQVA